MAKPKPKLAYGWLDPSKINVKAVYGNPASLPTPSTGLSSQGGGRAAIEKMLLNSNINWGATNFNSGPQAAKGYKAEPSLLGKIFDNISRFNYASAEAGRQLELGRQAGDIEIGDILQGAREGFNRQKRTTWRDVFALEHGHENYTKGDIWKGLAGDIFLDPLTYVGPGLFKLPSRLKDALKGVSGAPQDATQAIKNATTVKAAQSPPLGTQAPIQSPTSVPLPVISNPASAIKPGASLAKSPAFTPNPQSVLPAAISTPPVPAGLISTPKTVPGVFNQSVPNLPSLVPPSTAGITAQIPDDILKAINSADTVGKTNKQIKDLIADVANQTSQATGNINKFNKSQLLDVLSNLRQTAKTQAASPTPPPSISSHSVFDDLYSAAKRDDAASRLVTVFSGKTSNALAKIDAATDLAKYTENNANHGAIQDLVLALHARDPKAAKEAFRQVIGKPFPRSLEPNPTPVNSVTTGLTPQQLAVGQLKQASEQINVASQIFSPTKYNNFVNAITKANKKAGVAIGVPTGAVKVGNKVLKQAINLPLGMTPKVNKIIGTYISPGTHNKVWYPALNAQTAAIQHSSNYLIKPSLLTKLGRENQAAEWFLSRFSSWHGNKDLRPSFLNENFSAKAIAAQRANFLNTIAKTNTPSEILDAFRIYQGNAPRGVVPALDDLADQIGKQMDNLFDVSGLKSLANSAVFNSGMTLNDLNKQLKSVGMPKGFRFTNKAKVQNPVTGAIEDFSKGTDWLNSIKMYAGEEPLEFMMRLQTAVEQVMHRYAFIDEMGARWGSTVKTNFHTTKLDEYSSRMKGMYFPAEIADQANRIFKEWDQVYNPNSPMMKFIRSAVSQWKTGVTIYAPSHHIRNAIGDAYMAWISGVNNPFVYKKAMQVLSSQKNRYGDVFNSEELFRQGAIPKIMAKPGEVALVTKNGVKFTNEQLYIAAYNRGLLQSVKTVEDIFADPLIKIKPFGGRVHKAAGSVSEAREHIFRMGTFIDTVKKSKLKNPEEIINEAAAKTRKWHPDALDLTKFEKQNMRLLFPFYSWTRKAIPLVIEGAIKSPGKTVMYAKIMDSMQALSGIEAPSREDPFPVDQLFPEWIKESGVGPIFKHGSEGPLGAASSWLFGQARGEVNELTGNTEGYVEVDPGNPFADLVSQFSSPGKGIGSMLNPLVRVPYETIVTGETVQGVPISHDPNQYVTQNVPLATYLSSIGNLGLMGPTKRGQEEGLFNNEGFWNFLSALGIRGTAPYIKSAEFELAEKKARERASR